MNNSHPDGTSLTMFFLTIGTAWIQELTQSNILFMIAVISGVTSIVYNLVKTWNEWKGKKNLKKD
jgi:sulfite exporter TauE/SafE